MQATIPMFPSFQHIPTPFYYYDTALLRQTLDSLNAEVSKYPHYHVHYAIKANANPQLLSIIQQSGLGIDCVSGGELQCAVDAGFAASSVVFAGVGKSDWEIRLALELGILCFNVESLAELYVIQDIAAQMERVASVCLRVNPDVEAHTHTHIVTGRSQDKFGIDWQDLLPVIEQAQAMPNIRLRGLHFHIGSQITDMQDFVDLCYRINLIQEQLSSLPYCAQIINVGGGLGVDYQHPSEHPIPDFASYFAVFAQHLQLREGQSLHFELGRAIVAQCGSLITRVLYVKPTATKQFAIVDAGMTELIRPALYGAYHHIDHLSAQSDQQAMYDVVGPICESSDVFATDWLMPVTRRGDLLAIRSAGAYGESMASCYNCRPLPKTVVSES